MEVFVSEPGTVFSLSNVPVEKDTWQLNVEPNMVKIYRATFSDVGGVF